LTFDWYFDQPLIGLRFPSSLRVLRFGPHFTQSLSATAWTPSLSATAWTPPPMLEELDMGPCDKWDRPLTDLHLPQRLRKLTLPHRFNRPLENEQGECALQLPETLTELRFGPYFTQSLHSLNLPPSLRFLSLPRYAADYRLEHLPVSLPAHLQCLVVPYERSFQSSWAQHPTWPKQCADGYARYY